jgi:hypothetical protein
MDVYSIHKYKLYVNEKQELMFHYSVTFTCSPICRCEALFAEAIPN